jgi:tripeptide aminopeptidase
MTITMPIVLDTKLAIDRVVRLMAIPGKSCQERLISEAVIAELRLAGVPEDDIFFDDAHTRTRLPGEVGNLIVRISGTKPGPTTLLSAHLDTVPICVGCRPEIDGETIKSSDPKTGLGADNRGGVASILTAALEILKSEESYGPLVLCFFVQEEIGLQGSRNMDPSVLGPIDIAVNFDGGTVEKLTIGATGGERMTIEIAGRASHAGVAPEQGINAATIFALATSELHQQGWLGRVEQFKDGVTACSGTSNIGVVTGGDATNVVLPLLHVRAEARSHDSAMREQIVTAFRDAFASATGKVQAADGSTGSCNFVSHVDYDSFQLDENSPSVVEARKAIEAVGRKPYAEVAGGGLDANWLYRHGIHAVTLGCGQRNVHTVNERLVIADYLDACRIAIQVALR